MVKDKNRKILLVEDEKSISRAIKLKLSISGFETEIAENGVDALELLKTKKFDLILLDIMMPKMGGFEVMEEMKKNKDKTPIIVLSNLSQEEDGKRAKELGAVDFFVKSNSPLSEIVDRINKFLNV